MEQTALERLKSKYIFSIEGNIGSGKTTIIHHLQRLYGDQVILVEEPVKEGTKPWETLFIVTLNLSFSFCLSP